MKIRSPPIDCNETRRLLDADADGELDLVHHVELADHLRSCPACTRRADGVAARTAALREKLPRFAVPPGLEERIRAALPAAPAASDATTPARPRPTWRIVLAAASLLAAAWLGEQIGQFRARGDRLVEEAVASHVRSLQADHLTDVASTDQHTVKPWFAGRLDFAPPVADLAEAGFPLAGGRLDRIGGRTVAALVFRRRQHVVNLFLWPGGDAPVAARRAEKEGFRVATWTQGDWNGLAVSEIPADELARFVDAFQSATR